MDKREKIMVRCRDEQLQLHMTVFRQLEKISCDDLQKHLRHQPGADAYVMKMYVGGRVCRLEQGLLAKRSQLS